MKKLGDDPWRFACPHCDSRRITENLGKKAIVKRGGVNKDPIQLTKPFYCHNCPRALDEVIDLKDDRTITKQVVESGKLLGAVENIHARVGAE